MDKGRAKAEGGTPAHAGSITALKMTAKDMKEHHQNTIINKATATSQIY